MKKIVLVLLIAVAMSTNTAHASLPEVPEDMHTMPNEVKVLINEYLQDLLKQMFKLSAEVKGQAAEELDELIVFTNQVTDSLYE